jgi:hypothetical protein
LSNVNCFIPARTPVATLENFDFVSSPNGLMSVSMDETRILVSVKPTKKRVPVPAA